MPNWDFNCKTVYLTYSQIGDFRPEHIAGYNNLQQLLDFGTLSEISEFCAEEYLRFGVYCDQRFGRTVVRGGVAFEEHQDGTPHIHIIAELDRKLHTRVLNAFDGLYEQHPNWRHVDDWYAGTVYLSKGPYFFFSYDYKEVLAKKKSRPVQIAQMLNSGKTVKDVNAEHPSYVMVNLDKLTKYHDQLKDWKNSTLAVQKETDEHVFWDTLDLKHDELIDWMQANVFKTPVREMRKPQLWINGPTGIGKTSFLMRLESLGYKIYWYPIQDGKWMDDFDDTYDLIVIDEFRGQLKIQWLNSLVAGGPVNCPRRGRRPFLKRQNIPVIVTSNYDIRGCFHKVNQDDVGLHALETRFEELFSDTFLTGPDQISE